MTDLATPPNDTAPPEGSVPVPLTTRKDWSSDQEVRWCPGCGDYSILAAVQMLMPDLGVRRESRCSSRASAVPPGSPTT